MDTIRKKVNDMEQEVTNFARFYIVLNRIPKMMDVELIKETLVNEATGGRTGSLKEMTRKEYDDLCGLLERRYPDRSGIKKARSICLHLMQRIGLNTLDWIQIDKFCQNPRITGKRFSHLDYEELKALSIKLRMILKKQEEKELLEHIKIKHNGNQ